MLGDSAVMHIRSSTSKTWVGEAVHVTVGVAVLVGVAVAVAVAVGDEVGEAGVSVAVGGESVTVEVRVGVSVGVSGGLSRGVSVKTNKRMMPIMAGIPNLRRAGGREARNGFLYGATSGGLPV